MLQLSVDDISVNADVYGDGDEHSGNFDQLKVCFYYIFS